MQNLLKHSPAKTNVRKRLLTFGLVAILPACLLDSIEIFREMERALTALDQSVHAVLGLTDLEEIYSYERHFPLEIFLAGIRELQSLLPGRLDHRIFADGAADSSCAVDKIDQAPPLSALGRTCTYRAAGTEIDLWFPLAATEIHDASVTGHIFRSSLGGKRVTMEVSQATRTGPGRQPDLWVEPARVAIESGSLSTGEPQTTSTELLLNFGGCPDPVVDSRLCRNRIDKTDIYTGFSRFVSGNGITSAAQISGNIPLTSAAFPATFTGKYHLDYLPPATDPVASLTISGTMAPARRIGTATETLVNRDGTTTVTHVFARPGAIAVTRNTSYGRQVQTFMDASGGRFERTTLFEPGHNLVLRYESGLLDGQLITMERRETNHHGKTNIIHAQLTNGEGSIRGEFTHESREISGVLDIHQTDIGQQFIGQLEQPGDRVTFIDGFAMASGGFSANFQMTIPGADCDLVAARKGDQNVIGYFFRNAAGKTVGELRYCTGRSGTVNYARITRAPGKPITIDAIASRRQVLQTPDAGEFP